MSVTRGYLRYRVGRKVGDSVRVEATADGTTTSVTDTIRLTGAPSVYAGRSLYCTSATNIENVGEWREVTDSVDGVLTVSPAFPMPVLTGDVFQLSDERDRGFSPEEIIEAINDAHLDAGVFGDVRVTEELSEPFTQDTGQMSIPTSLTALVAVYWEDGNGETRETYPAASVESDGWFLLPGRVVQVNGPLRSAMDGATVTLAGYGPPGALENDSDTTEVNPEWLVWRACAALYEQGIDRDPTRERRAFHANASAVRLEPTLFLYRDAGARSVLP